MTDSFVIEPLDSRHNRTSFASGVSPLDRYIREQATQDIRRHAAACYVAIQPPDTRIAGYYTIAASSIPLTALPDALTKRLPRYPSVPVARIGRLAVDREYQGRKLGAAFLWDAGMRALRSEIAVFALVVDAKDEKAVAFYRHHGFVSLSSQPTHLVLPLATFSKA